MKNGLCNVENSYKPIKRTLPRDYVMWSRCSDAHPYMLCELLKLHPALDGLATVGLCDQQMCPLSPAINCRNEIKDFVRTKAKKPDFLCLPLL